MKIPCEQKECVASYDAHHGAATGSSVSGSRTSSTSSFQSRGDGNGDASASSDSKSSLPYPWNITRQESQRRQEIGRLIHSIWTGDCGDSGLAEFYFDGRVDLLGLYQTFLFDEDDDYSHMEADNSERFRAVDTVDCHDLTYADFVETYMRPNRPVLIRGLASDWQATKDWVSRRDSASPSEPNLLHLSEHFGHESVYVFEQSGPGFTASRPRRKRMTIAEYAAWWEEHRSSSSATTALSTESQSQLFYMKDWAFLRSNPTCDAYQCPPFFQDDWLNKATDNAYAFCYVGPKGTSTILHADVLLSFSWSTNVCGTKKWFLVPPELTFLLYDCFGTSLATNLHSDVNDGVGVRFPGLQVARRYAYMLIQEEGETLFVPSKWFHTVQNLEACLSINHNWLNGSNIRNGWDNLEKELQALAQAGEEFGDCSPIIADLKLLWAVIVKAVMAGCLEDVDINAVSAIVERIDALGLYDYIDGGEAEAEVHLVTNLLQRMRAYNESS